MRIRTKLTILFLLIALVPLTVLTGLDTVIMYRLGQDMAQDMRGNLTALTEEQLNAALRHYTDILSLEGKLAQARGFAPGFPTGHDPGTMGRPGMGPLGPGQGLADDSGMRPGPPPPPPDGSDPISIRVMKQMFEQPHMQNMVVLLMTPGQGGDNPRLITEIATDIDPSQWLPGMSPREFDPGSQAAEDEILRAMQATGGGSFRAPYLGRESLWVFSQFGQSEKAFMVLPLDRIKAMSAEAESNIIKATSLTLWNNGAMGLFGIIVAALLGLFASRHVTNPLERLSKAATLVARGDFDARAAIPGTDELSVLGRTFDDMVPQLQDRVQMQQALDLASEVQRRLLPLRTPEVDGVDIAGLSTPCDETGGDYYDFLDTEALGPGRARVLVGDVTGHGVSAALLMATARGLLRASGGRETDMVKRITRANDLLCADVGDSGQFMTMFALELDRREAMVRYVRAGHDPGLLYDPNTDVMERLEGEPAPLLGILEGFEYQAATRTGLTQGQVLLIGTDGIWESFSPGREMYGKDRLHALLREHHSKSAQGILDAVMHSLEVFRGGIPAEDDTTLVVVKFLPVSEDGLESASAPGRRAGDRSAA